MPCCIDREEGCLSAPGAGLARACAGLLLAASTLVAAPVSSPAPPLARQLEELLRKPSSSGAAGYSAEQWTDIARHLGDPALRSATLDLLRKTDPFPAALWVGLLDHEELAVRLGALEVLEDHTGQDLAFDPWETDAVVRRLSLQPWRDWLDRGASKSIEDARPAASDLGDDAVQAWLRDFITDDSAKIERAHSRLRPHARQMIGAIETFLDEQQATLQEGARARLKEAQYRLLLDFTGHADARRTARLLSMGTRDERLQGLEALAASGKSVLPIVVEQLRDSDSLVRETAMDTLLVIGQAASIDLAAEHLKNEPDLNVLHAALRALGKIESAASSRVLLSHLGHEDEDVVTAALQSLSLLGDQARSAKSRVEPLLKHDSWRVRAAALQCIAKARITGLEKAIDPLIDDDDSFVRNAALTALVTTSSEGESSFFDPFGSRGGNAKDKYRLIDRLVAVFEKHDDLKGPVFRLMNDRNLEVPEKLIQQLRSSAPEVRALALPTLNPSGKAAFAFLTDTAGGDDLDLACVALSQLAAKAANNTGAQPWLIAALTGDVTAKRDAVLERLDWKEGRTASSASWQEALQALGAATPPVVAKPATAPATAGADSLAARIVAAFAPALANHPGHSPAVGGPATRATAEGALAERIVAAFSPAPVSAEPVATHAIVAQPEAGTIAEALLRLTERQPFDATARSAMRLLVRAGHGGAAPLLDRELASLDVQDRLELADVLKSHPHPAFLPAWRRLLEDPAREVRKRAFYSAVYEEERTPLLRFALHELLRPGSVLQPEEAYSYYLEAIADDDKTKRIALEYARLLAQTSQPAPSQVLGLILLRRCGVSADTDLLVERAASPDYWVRRAAVFALSRVNPRTFMEKLPQFAGDSSAWVREAAAIGLAREVCVWQHHFDDATEAEDERGESSYSFQSRTSKPPALSAQAEAALRELARDREERVVLPAWMSLLVHRKDIDAGAVAAALDRSPHIKKWGYKLAEFIENNYAQFGASLRPLIERIDWRRVRGDRIATIERHFGMAGQTVPSNFKAFAVGRQEPVSAPTQAADAGAADVLDAGTETATLVYFFSPGCPECASARREIDALLRQFPGVTVQEHNIRDTSAVLLNESLSRMFDIPPHRRALTPAVFMREGALIKDEISRSLLLQLAAMTLENGDDGVWHQPVTGEIEEAREEVDRRFQNLQLTGVFLAGLLDGINPCAFATIIFFLSYLQIAGRARREMLAVGAAFILGIFLSYFVLGLGLVEVVARIDAIRAAGQALNWLLAAACLVIALLSFRDARLADAGQLKEMTLQLPAAIKERIHRVIRSGARSRRFIAGAFVTGLIIAVLELACTGQVYLPTIVYGLKSGATSAVGLLLWYNLAFIIPLVVIFVLAWRGLTSARLIEFQKNHTGTVKRALGWLFLALFAMLLWSGRL